MDSIASSSLNSALNFAMKCRHSKSHLDRSIIGMLHDSQE